MAAAAVIYRIDLAQGAGRDRARVRSVRSAVDGTPPGCALASVSGAARSPPTASSVDVSSILGYVPGDRQQRRRMRHQLEMIQESVLPEEHSVSLTHSLTHLLVLMDRIRPQILPRSLIRHRGITWRCFPSGRASARPAGAGLIVAVETAAWRRPMPAACRPAAEGGAAGGCGGGKPPRENGL